MSDVLQSVLKTKLQTVVDNYITGSTSATNVLNVALSVWAQNEANILVVTSVDDLPYLAYYTSPNSILCFISNIGVFAISSNLKWITLDGRLLRTDTVQSGIIFSWGNNSTGRLGDNTTTNSSSPVSVVGQVANWCDLGTGCLHTVAVRSSGSAWAWGSNALGRLGDNTTTNRSSPVSVVGGFTDWCQITAGTCHTVAVRTSGSAWSWGGSASYQLGDGTSVSKSSPVSVGGAFSDWCQVSGGFAHSVGLRSNGQALAWGSNTCGRLGDNSITTKTTPSGVSGGFSDWCQANAGFAHSVAIRTGGTAWAWGCNGNGTLGDNSTVPKSSPVSVVGGFTDWCQAGAGSYHTAAVRTNGSIWSWGTNAAGQLGDNTSTNKSSPVSVVGGFTNWCQLDAVTCHTVAVRTSGTAWAWGCNGNGRLGDNTTTTRSSPVSVVGGFTNWCQVNGAFDASAGIRNT